ncbi:hypothetical protein KUCAC02_006114 [Chaenocephalus aceratus]|uniref:Uncharacterized protein n=1 Tax=Chaenocephalus aceratus TaxID=36190 RepID=A0ACB9WSC5_CHAAC|nr:hypothetical protein KUCAC02_006114 [Chaenocephalus aceratus]
MYCTLCQAAAAIPSLQRYQRTVGSIYGYFSNSSSRQARLEEMHVILDTDDVKLKSCRPLAELRVPEQGIPAKVPFLRKCSACCNLNDQGAMQIGDEGGPKFQEFLANIAENNGETYFKGEKIKVTRAMRQAVDGVRQRFLDTLIQNIEDRFPDIGLFSAFRIFDPRCLPWDNMQFGRDELRTILDHLCPVGREPIVDTDTCSTEWSPFKELVHANYSNNSFQELVKIMAAQHAGFLPETTKLLAAISVIPMSTVPCGRGFSIQNRIKTKGRARIKAEHIDVLMRICIEGPPIEQFDFYKALEKFRVEKYRRIYQGPCKERCPCRQR